MEKSWFEKRIGKTVIRTNTYDQTKTEWPVTQKNVGYLWQFTLKGFTYEDVATKEENVATDQMEATSANMEQVGTDWLEAARPTVRIHRTLQACISCEG